MKVGVIGLGLIGGSMAKAIKEKTEHQVFAWDASEKIRNNAVLVSAVDGILEEGNPEDCDMVIIAIYPGATVEYIKTFAEKFKKGCTVIDCAGVKEMICDAVKPISEEQGFLFCGGHPMAGVERSGFTYSTASMFNGATMILTPYTGTDIAPMNDLSIFFKKLGFAKMQVATPKEHDQMIAYTSQLAHVVSSAYVKSALSPNFKGFSAGSFHDMTRVAKMNETMWTELFLANNELLADEIDELVTRLQRFSSVIREKHDVKLKAMLKDGKEKRLAVDEVKEFE